MNLQMNINLIPFYNNESQRVRIMSELWASENLFCPCCGNKRISKLSNNASVADLTCEKCGEIFELKSKHGNIGNKINDGAYDTMIERITSQTNPDLFIAQYSEQYSITDLTIIPKFFFVPDIIEKRNPLAPTAKRAGWIGCNILYSNIPQQGRIEIIKSGIVRSTEEVVETYSRISKIRTNQLEARGWLLDVLNCVNEIPLKEFSLGDVYSFAELLQHKHINNGNIEAKIRQQLQILRDKGFIEFLGRGQYRKLV